MKRIVTHPGSAHKDDFLACALLVYRHNVPVYRREPSSEDLDDPGVAVVDVGERHEPEKANFDHHQFPRDHEPICALSLVLDSMGLYEDARELCDWLEPAEWFDTRGPVGTAKWLGVERRIMNQLHSPIDVTLMRRFANERELRPGHPVWEVMRMIGEDLVIYLTGLRKRLSFIGEHAEFWEVGENGGAFRVLFMPRTDPMPADASGGLERFIVAEGQHDQVVAMVYPDRRGSGYGLSRYEDSPLLDFTRIGDEDDVHFAHARGFVAKTTATDPGRLRQLLGKAVVK